MEPRLTAEELSAFLDKVFPQVRGDFIVEEVASMRARLRMKVAEPHLRPGGTVSGPAMFTLADCAYYAATLAMIGREALTVTTSLTINFLAKPPAADLVCEARILRLGRVLSVGEAVIWSDGREDGPVAHASVTYAVPPARN